MCDSTVIIKLFMGGVQMIIIDPRNRTPIFEQIKEQIINKVNLGELKPDDKLPSLRQLASDLNLNVNTVKRAFQELEAEKVTYSVAGKGVFISEEAINNTRIIENAENELKRSIISGKARGLTKEQIFSLTEKIFNEENNND